MRRTALVLNSIVVVFFACFLTYTFFARQHLNSLARAFVTEKTLKYSKPIVELADVSLGSPVVRKLLSKEQRAVLRMEITDYQQDPIAYISDLTKQKVRDLPVDKGQPLLAKVAAIKQKIRTFYDNTMNALIIDLRIFAVSNLIAGMIAFSLALRSPPAIRYSIVGLSVLMFAAVLFCSYMYVDNLTFFRILFRTHMGWSYPIVLCLAIGFLYRDFRRPAKAVEPRDIGHGTAEASLSHKPPVVTR